MHFRSTIVILSLILPAAIACSNAGKEKKESAMTVQDSSSSARSNESMMLFGIHTGSFNIISGRIKPNGLLSGILAEHGVTAQEIEQVTEKSKNVFDVRNIRAGNAYHLFCDTGFDARARYLVYEHEPSISYIFSFNDSLNITPYKKEIKKVIRYSSGTIKTSFWDSMIAGGLQPELVIELSDIFAWTVDFFGLQNGDSFKIIYEETFIDGKPLGIGRIFGAQFNCSGKAITAIPFIQDDRESFFDCDGKSLRKAFLKAPLRFSRITSRFSSGRMHPILRVVRPHFGVDYAAPVGTPVHSIGDGRVVSAAEENGSGKMVRIVHNSVYSTAYLHLSKFGDGISPGAFVKQGEIIGYVGNSGLSTGPHLDFRIYQNGYPVDPLKVEAPPVEPVSEANKNRFETDKSIILNLLSTF